MLLWKFQRSAASLFTNIFIFWSRFLNSILCASLSSQCNVGWWEYALENLPLGWNATLYQKRIGTHRDVPTLVILLRFIIIVHIKSVCSSAHMKGSKKMKTGYDARVQLGKLTSSSSWRLLLYEVSVSVRFLWRGC